MKRAKLPAKLNTAQQVGVCIDTAVGKAQAKTASIATGIKAKVVSTVCGAAKFVKDVNEARKVHRALRLSQES